LKRQLRSSKIHTVAPTSRRHVWTSLLCTSELDQEFPGLYRAALAHCSEAVDVVDVIRVDVPRTLSYVIDDVIVVYSFACYRA